MATLRDIYKFIEWDPGLRIYKPVFWRRNMLPSWLSFDAADTVLPLTIPAAAPGIGVTSVFKQTYSSVEGLDANLGTPFAVQNLMFADSTDGTAAADFTVTLKEVGEAREFMNRPHHVRNICGVSQTPAILREPYLFISQHNIQARFEKISGGATTMRMYLGGAQYYPWDPNFMVRPDQKKLMTDRLRRWMNRRKYVSPYWLTTDIDANLNANQTANFRGKIGDDGHFEVYGLTAVATGNFGLSISEVKTKQTIMNGAITQTNGIGTANFPAIFFKPYLVPAGYQLNFEITDLTGAPNTVFLTLFGRKVFARIQDVRDVLRSTEPIPTMVDIPTPMIPKPI